MSLSALHLRAVRATPVLVPMTFTLGTSAAIVREAPLLLVDLETEEGVTGHACQFCYTPAAAAAVMRMLDDAAAALRGEAVDPALLWAKLDRRYTLIGVEGIVRMAMAMIDVAAWDALAIAAGQPLAALLGAAPRAVPAYNSCGLGLMAPAAVADEAERLLEGGFTAIKLRLGYPTLAGDLAALRAVRSRVPDSVSVMTDYNQALTVDEALVRGRALDSEGACWIEEPVRHDDYAGCARLAREIATPVQIGENFSQVFDMQKAIAASACDLVMTDLERIGGVSGWLKARDLAASAGLKLSSHLYPEVSAHLLCATPTAHWLEYVDWANAVLETPMLPRAGCVHPGTGAGNGLRWDAGKVRHYRMQ